MSIKAINEGFKSRFIGVINESVEPSQIDELRTALEDAAFQLSMRQVMNLKAYEIAFQDAIEKLYPDNAWWEVTDCNIFMDLFEHRDIDHTINEIVNQLKVTDVVEEAKSIKESSTTLDESKSINEDANKRREFFNESKKAKGIKILSEDVKVYRETDLTDFEFWSGALDRVEKMTDDELRQMSFILEEMYPDGMTETEVNDIFWFKEDWIAEMLGYDSFDEIYNRDMNESLTEDKFDDMEPEVWDYPDEDTRLSDTYSYTPYSNVPSEITDRIRRKGYIGAATKADTMTPIRLDDTNCPDFNRSYLSKKDKKKMPVGV